MGVDPVSLAITVALNAAVMGMTAMQKIEGPRLSDLKATTSDYGTPLVQFYGTKRLECPCVYAEDVREEKHTSKTKGGKYSEYKYFGTWANFIADHQIDAVIKMWLDKHLALDRTGTSGPVMPLLNGPFGIDVKLENSNQWRVYLGTETQQPDPRLVATIEAREGPGTCPAYLGAAYMVFEDVPLEKFGNRMPQAGVEATRAAVPHYPYEIKDAPHYGLNLGAFSRDFRRFVTLDSAGSGFFALWDIPSRNMLYNGAFPGAAVGDFVFTEGNSIYVRVGAFDVQTVNYDVTGAGLIASGNHPINSIYYAGGLGCLTALTGHNFAQFYNGGAVTELDVGFKVLSYLNGPDDLPWALGVSGTDIKVRQIGGASANLTIANPAGGGATPFGLPNSEGNIVLFQAQTILVIDTDGNILHSGGLLGALGRESIINHDRSDTIWSQNSQYSLLDGSLIRTIPYTSWTTGRGSDMYDPINDALFGHDPAHVAKINWLYLDRVTGNGWTLGDICADVAVQTGQPESAIDFSDLDQIVLGYSWTQGPGKDIVGPLLDLYDSDIRPHQFIQEGLKRGQPLSGDTISTAWLVPTGEQALYRVPMTPETELPRRVFANFSDPTAEDQPNTAIAQRNAASVKTDREATLDLGTLTIAPDDMQPILERALRRYWVGATKPETRLSPLEIRLEPGDCRMLSLDGELLRVRCVRADIKADRSIDTMWEVDGEVEVNPPSWELDDAASVNTLHVSPGAVSLGRTNDTILIAALTKGFVFDTPLLFDADDQTAPFLYDAAGQFGPGFWPGASVWTSDENEPDSVFAAGWDDFGPDQLCIWGQASVLPNAESDVMDEATVLTVLFLDTTSLASVTLDALLASQALNLALVGGELIQFRDAVLVDTNTYQLSGLIRGARGTEYAIASHAAGETFLLISSKVHKRTIGASEIGDTDYYRFATPGDNVDSAETIAVPFAANAQRPLSPAHLTLVRDAGTGDWTISWVRRTRIGGSTINGQDVPLGETSELYRVKIMDGPDVLASYDVTTQSKFYPSSEQIADWGGAQTSLSVQVVQVSPALSLEGFAAVASA